MQVTAAVKMQPPTRNTAYRLVATATALYICALLHASQQPHVLANPTGNGNGNNNNHNANNHNSNNGEQSLSASSSSSSASAGSASSALSAGASGSLASSSLLSSSSSAASSSSSSSSSVPSSSSADAATASKEKVYGKFTCVGGIKCEFYACVRATLWPPVLASPPIIHV